MFVDKEEALSVEDGGGGGDWSLGQAGDDLVSFAFLVIVILYFAFLVFFNFFCLSRVSLFELYPIFRFFLLYFHRFMLFEFPLVPIKNAIVFHAEESSGNGGHR